MTREEEKLLFERVVRGEHDAISIFYEHYKRLAYSTIRKFTFVPEYEVEDYFQEFMKRLMEKDWRRLKLWNGNCLLSTYLVTILKNYLTDEYRKHQPMEDETAIDEVAEDPRDDIDDKIYIDTLRPYFKECTEALLERDREIINRKFYQDETADVIASALNITKAAYYTAFNRAQTRLVERLKMEYPFLFEEPV